MKKPETLDEDNALQEIYKNDPYRFIRIATNWIELDKNDDSAYFTRQQGWMKVGESQKALDDLNKVIELNPNIFAFWGRGDFWFGQKEYVHALDDYNLAEAFDPNEWQNHGIGLLFQSDCHAHLGDEAAALACCARLPDDFWTPGLLGAPSGGKDVLPDKFRSIAAAVRAGPVDRASPQ